MLGVLMRQANAECNRLAVEALDVSPTDTVLELGFGPGHALRMLAGRTPRGRVYGIEHSGVMLGQATARNRIAVREGRMLLQQGRCQALPFASASIDAVLAVNVAYFWASGDPVVREIHRVLRPQGKLALYVTHRNSTRRWRFTRHGTHRHWDGDELAAVLQAAGFAAAATRIQTLRLRGGVQGLLAVTAVGDRPLT